MFGLFNSASEASDSHQDVSGAEGVGIRGGGTVARDGSLALGNKAKLIQPGAYDFGGAKGDITINSADPEVFQAALDAIIETNAARDESVQKILDQVSSTSAASAAAAGGNLDKVLAQLAPLAESKQTDGQSGINKTFLAVVLAVAAVLGVIAWRNR